MPSCAAVACAASVGGGHSAAEVEQLRDASNVEKFDGGKAGEVVACAEIIAGDDDDVAVAAAVEDALSLDGARFAVAVSAAEYDVEDAEVEACAAHLGAKTRQFFGLIIFILRS